MDITEELNEELNKAISEELLKEEFPNITDDEVKYIAEQCKNPWDSVIMYKLLKETGKL